MAKLWNLLCKRQKFRGKNNSVQAKMTHTHERIYPIHIGTKVFLKYNLTVTFHFHYIALGWKRSKGCFQPILKKKDKLQSYKELSPIGPLLYRVYCFSLSKAGRHSPFFNVNRFVFEWSFIANYNRVNWD